ncbi:hypothetical protein JMJ35_007545 [Cladonia borealis]|uniref:Uncharacterized protein n=1 Tax=Cladonia borealis TaxID=184061 RepID=A0AA39QXC5_9LECA|nr:hypothetical protein JMJ35_007545 [Cladonia borealis]
MLDQGDESGIPVPAVFMFVPNMPVVVNQNTHQGLKLVNGASYTAVEVVLDRKYPAHRISAGTILHFGPPAGILLASETTKDLHLVGMPPGLILLAPTSCKIGRAKKRPWQWHDAVRKGLPCTPGFACTDYKVQGRTLEQVAKWYTVMLLSRAREKDVVGNTVPKSMAEAEKGLEVLSEATIKEVEENWEK